MITRIYRGSKVFAAIHLILFVINKNQCIFKTALLITTIILKMNEHLKLQKEKLIKRLVSNSKAILSNQIGLPLGVSKMGSIITWLNNIEPIANISLEIVYQYNSCTSSYFLGPERLSCSKDFLIKQDQDLDKINSKYKEEIMAKCFEIIELFDSSGKV